MTWARQLLNRTDRPEIYREWDKLDNKFKDLLPETLDWVSAGVTEFCDEDEYNEKFGKVLKELNNFRKLQK